MTERDLLVASVALVLGTMMLHSALVNQGWCFQLAFARKIEQSRGPTAARFAIGSVGSFVIFLGVCTLCAPYVFVGTGADEVARERGNSSDAPSTLIAK